ncbi:MAG TPA: hypothetical protein VFK57_22170 [Vicinamibacterales bacterium]|nr:hypothetical protein [Vicinamibacterales bacterium]
MCIGRAAGSVRAALIAAALAIAAMAPLSVHASERYDPRLRFRTIRTPHFDIHAHRGEEALARRLAAIAERVFEQSRTTLGVPRGRVQVILVDQNDVSNGWATPFPYDTIEIAAAAPPVSSLIGNTTDWLELVFIHEYTHILHLDRTRGFMQGVRRTFGRVPAAFPNGFLPVWQIEGLATFQESRTTGQGRVPAGDFRAIVDVAASQGRFEPIDRVSGGLTDWPGGHAPYAYGAYFHQFLADRYGAERLAQLADATSGRLPFFGAGAFKTVFGRSSSDLWKEFRGSRTSPAPSRTDARARRLTHHGFTVTAPRAAPDGTIFYAVANPHGFPALMRLRPGGEPSRVAWRALGGRTSIGREWIVFDQVERVRSVAIYSDLYAVRTTGGGVERLTRGLRLADPDLSPDGGRIVATSQATGRRALVLLPFTPGASASPRTLVDDPEADYEAPRWSPDGRTIAAARRYKGAFDLVLVDPQSGGVHVLYSRDDARIATPSWAPDGQAVLFASADGTAPFQICWADRKGFITRLTDTVGGAHSPELAADGTLIYVGYTKDGSDLFSVAYDPRAITRGQPEPWVGSGRRTSDPAPQSAGTATLEGGAADSFKYDPLRTLAPTYWTPVIETDAGETVIGAGTAMTDALGRHAYAASAGWSTRARPDWSVSYAYDRWRPTIFASYSDDTDPVRLGAVRSRELFAGALLAFRRLRASDTFAAGFDAQTDTLTCDEPCAAIDPRRDLRSLRGGWLHDRRRQFGYSIGAEEGFALQVAGETSREALGSDGNASAAIVDLRGFQRVFTRHTVLAARIAAAASFGDNRARRLFSAAGAGPSYPVFDFGRDAIGLLRGVAPDDLVGTRAAVLNLDLRVPLARPQRGAGTWPIFLHTVHAAAFVDAGHAWDRRFRAADIRTSTGAEISADVVVLHYVPLTLTGGAAWTHGAGRDRLAGFARIGYAF